MKKQIYITGLAAMLSVLLAMPAFAGQWQQDPGKPMDGSGISGWWYQRDDGTYPAGGWEWIDGNGDGIAECYYFDGGGWMYASTKTPDDFQVNENGAWVVDGNIQVKQAESGQNPVDNSEKKTGWVKTEDGGTMYYTSSERYVTGWKKIDKKKYFFDESGYMVTGYQELDDGTYYFYEDGHLADETVRVDDLYYVVDEDGRVMDEVAVEDWTEYRRDNGISASADEIKNKTYDWDDGINEEMALDFLDLVNEQRKKKGLSSLEINNDVMEAAQIRAEEIVERFSHTRPDGSSCYTALEEIGAGDYSNAGENIAFGQSTPARVVDAWMNSSGHKANILNKKFTETGVACYIYNGNPYWVQMFYTP